MTYLYCLYSIFNKFTGSISLEINNQYTTMMSDIAKTDKMFGVVLSDGKGQFCEIGTAVENIKQEFYRGE